MLIREVIGRSHGHNWHYLGHCGELCPFLWHYHPEYELTLTRHTHGTRYVGSDVQPFGELDLVLVAPNCAHTWHSTEDRRNDHVQTQVVFFTLEWLQALAAEGLPELHAVNQWLGSVRQGVVFSPRRTEQLLPLFDRLEATRGLQRLAVLLQIFDALAHDVDARYLGAHITNIAAGGGSDRRVEAALAHLQQHYRSVVSLESIAAAAVTSASTLKRLFQERLGMSVTDVLIQLRIGHACHLLVSTELPIHRVASDSGFNNLGHFFRQFSAQRGCTPTEFRRQNGLPDVENAVHHARYGNHPVESAIVAG